MIKKKAKNFEKERSRRGLISTMQRNDQEEEPYQNERSENHVESHMNLIRKWKHWMC